MLIDNLAMLQNDYNRISDTIYALETGENNPQLIEEYRKCLMKILKDINDVSRETSNEAIL